MTSPPVAPVTLRRADEGDIPLLVRHRRLMIEEIRLLKQEQVGPEELAALDAAYGAFLRDRIPSGPAFAFIAERDGVALASGTASPIGDWPPTLKILHAHQVLYVYGVYTDKDQRGQGLASRVMDAIAAEAASRGIPIVTLYASEAGKPVYERGGFVSRADWMTRQG